MPKDVLVVDFEGNICAVSYTHLDVYKRQIIHLFYVTVGGIALIWKKQKT